VSKPRDPEAETNPEVPASPRSEAEASSTTQSTTGCDSASGTEADSATEADPATNVTLDADASGALPSSGALRNVAPQAAPDADGGSGADRGSGAASAIGTGLASEADIDLATGGDRRADSGSAPAAGSACDIRPGRTSEGPRPPDADPRSASIDEPIERLVDLRVNPRNASGPSVGGFAAIFAEVRAQTGVPPAERGLAGSGESPVGGRSASDSEDGFPDESTGSEDPERVGSGGRSESFGGESGSGPSRVGLTESSHGIDRGPGAARAVQSVAAAPAGAEGVRRLAAVRDGDDSAGGSGEPAASDGDGLVDGSTVADADGAGEGDAAPVQPELDELADPDRLRSALEAVLLVVDTPTSAMMLAQVLGRSVPEVETGLRSLRDEYDAVGRGLDLREVADGWRLYSRDEYAGYVERFILDGQRARLTQAALETLAVIAYRQPVTRSRISAIRGVSVDAVMRTLLTRGLVEECGADPDTGGGLYRTTTLFLEKMGLRSLDELPSLAPLLPDTSQLDDVELST
jgi:segregation and condensation protein B